MRFSEARFPRFRGGGVRGAALSLLLLFACSGGSNQEMEWQETLVLRGAAGTIDLLLVVDNSNDMAEEQVVLARALPSLIDSLRNETLPDGTPFNDVLGVHVGVITTDMGAPGVPTCGESDDGLLQRRGNVAISGCRAEYPSFLEFRADASADVADLPCLAVVGTMGCGFELPLEAALKAITPASSDIAFASGTGHIDGANDGFWRDGATHVAIVLTNDDDCSTSDPRFYEPEGLPGEIRLRCFEHADELAGVERYGNGFAAADLDLLAVIAGVPLDREQDSFSDILSDPRMEKRVSAGNPLNLEPVCRPLGTSVDPARRLVETAAAFEARGGRSIVRSICRDDYADAVDDILREIASAHGGPTCLSQPFPRTPDGAVDCILVEFLPPGSPCERAFREGMSGEQVVCRVPEVSPAGDEPGWFPDEESAAAIEQCGVRPYRIGRRGGRSGEFALRCGRL